MGLSVDCHRGGSSRRIRFFASHFGHLPFEPADTTLQKVDLSGVQGFFEVSEEPPKSRPPALGVRCGREIAHEFSFRLIAA
jgi:hypothetical protein